MPEELFRKESQGKEVLEEKYIYIAPNKLQEFSKYWQTKGICGYVVNLNILWQYKTVLPVEVYMYIEV